MVKKNVKETQEQAEALKANGLKPFCWEVLKDLPESLIVKHRVTGEVKLIRKKGVKV